MKAGTGDGCYVPFNYNVAHPSLIPSLPLFATTAPTPHGHLFGETPHTLVFMSYRLIYDRLSVQIRFLVCSSRPCISFSLYVYLFIYFFSRTHQDDIHGIRVQFLSGLPPPSYVLIHILQYSLVRRAPPRA